MLEKYPYFKNLNKATFIELTKKIKKHPGKIGIYLNALIDFKKNLFPASKIKRFLFELEDYNGFTLLEYLIQTPYKPNFRIHQQLLDKIQSILINKKILKEEEFYFYIIKKNKSGFSSLQYEIMNSDKEKSSIYLSIMYKMFIHHKISREDYCNGLVSLENCFFYSNKQKKYQYIVAWKVFLDYFDSHKECANIFTYPDFYLTIKNKMTITIYLSVLKSCLDHDAITPQEYEAISEKLALKLKEKPPLAESKSQEEKYHPVKAKVIEEKPSPQSKAVKEKPLSPPGLYFFTQRNQAHSNAMGDQEDFSLFVYPILKP